MLNTAFEPTIHYLTVVDSGAIRINEDQAKQAVMQGRPVEMTTIGNGQTFQVLVKLDADGNPCIMPVMPDRPIGAEKSQVFGQLLIHAGLLADDISHMID
jgi:hypothetical protein